MISRVLLAEGLLRAGATAGPVIGLDTGSAVARLGLVSEGKILASAAYPAKSHGADLPVAIAELLEASGLKLGDIRAIAVGIGPGSFTGLRVGLSYVKGLALAAKLKVASVPSLDAIALCAVDGRAEDREVTICSIIDARKGEVYASLYRVADDALERKIGDELIALEKLTAQIEGNAIFAGEAKAEEACAHFNLRGGHGVAVGNARLQLIGGLIAAIGAARVAHGDADQIFSLEPRYVRPSDATVKLTALDPGEAIHGTTRGRANPAIFGQ